MSTATPGASSTSPVSPPWSAATAGTTDVVGAFVTEGALRRRDLVISSDPEDLKALAAAVNRHLEVDRP